MKQEDFKIKFREVIEVTQNHSGRALLWTGFIWLYIHFFAFPIIMVGYVPAFQALPLEVIIRAVGYLTWLVYIFLSSSLIAWLWDITMIFTKKDESGVQK